MERTTLEKPIERVQTGGSRPGAVKPSGERVFITWLPFSSRSETLAKSFGAVSVYFGYLAGGNNLLKIALRYLLMTIHTIGFVLSRKPKLVYVMNQPVFLPLTLFLLSRIMRVKYVIDSHSGLFNKKEWQWALPLMKYAYRHSLFSIVTNKNHCNLVESWGAKAEILGALTVGEEEVVPFNRVDDPSMVVIGTFASDEPLEEILEACQKLPHVKFYVTGALKKAPPELISSAPENVIFTDFISRPEYVGLVRAMDAAIILVTHDDVMQRGAYEAMSWGVPIITSDWLILRESFTKGTMFVDNTPAAIAGAVNQLLENPDHYKNEIDQLRRERADNWDRNIERINAYTEKNL
ncbi:hypothetical protein CEE37_03025 [candidate division LCP-89 bacterium B3_LCP]|uniref:Glycosyl transferase family 1 domain-containing protein n=1 Tax=candidate division LCP-89 bacterium B3_LCP TaxID=2012998 RepID=A0A532V350_UNCL8|nr:MAG: hypothetical protein CEE37_03025 [candidate division LCP-89 bacterium B3_LCP]